MGLGKFCMRVTMLRIRCIESSDKFDLVVAEEYREWPFSGSNQVIEGLFYHFTKVPCLDCLQDDTHAY